MLHASCARLIASRGAPLSSFVVPRALNVFIEQAPHPLNCVESSQKLCFLDLPLKPGIRRPSVMFKLIVKDVATVYELGYLEVRPD